MTDQHIHIVSLDVPYPADYGGAIDIYYRIQALHKLGYKITLHCYEYGRGKAQGALEAYTETCHYYIRKKPLVDWLSGTPFIVKTRSDKHLLENLQKDNHPILFEGLHTTFFLADERLENRTKIVRAHNVEHDYYAELAKQATGAKKIFFQSEARKLEKYEPVLKHADHILAIQQNDLEHFKTFHKSVHLLPASLPTMSDSVFVETEPYCLFHGNLSVPENENAVRWIVNTLSTARLNLVIAGKNPSDELKKLCQEHSVKLVSNPDQATMDALIQKARVHVLYTNQPTGLKLKLLQALNTSGHVLVNDKMIAGTQLENLCAVENEKDAFRAKAIELINSQPLQEDFDRRQEFLNTRFNTEKNCALFAKLING